MKVALVYPKIEELSLGFYTGDEHLGLAYIGGALKEASHDVHIIDAHMLGLEDKVVVEKLKKGKYDIIGLSAVYSNFSSALSIAKALYYYDTSIKLIFGGEHATFAAEKILKDSPEIYAVVRGEGEQTIVELVNNIEKSIEPILVKGVYYRSGDSIIKNPDREAIVDIDSIKEPVHISLEKGIQNNIKATLNVLCSRGCLGTCSFCNANSFFSLGGGSKWRCRSPKKIVDEIEYLINRYGKNKNIHDTINLCDLNFINSSPRGIDWVQNFISEMEQRNIECFFYILTRVDSIMDNQKLVKTLREIGLVQVEMGLEAGSTSGLEVYKKGIKLNQSYEAINFLRELRIDVTPSGFVTYHPYSTVNELRNNAIFLKNINFFKIIHLFSKVALYPGSNLTRQVITDGLVREGYQHYKVYHYDFCDSKVQTIYEKILTLNNVKLQYLSNMINYIEYKKNIILRKLERKYLGKFKEINETIIPFEDKVDRYLAAARDEIYNFFMQILDLAEDGWSETSFEGIKATFNHNYLSYNEPIIDSFRKMLIYINNISNELGKTKFDTF